MLLLLTVPLIDCNCFNHKNSLGIIMINHKFKIIILTCICGVLMKKHDKLVEKSDAFFIIKYIYEIMSDKCPTLCKSFCMESCCDCPLYNVHYTGHMLVWYYSWCCYSTASSICSYSGDHFHYLTILRNFKKLADSLAKSLSVFTTPECNCHFSD